ncbi:hypothetical protein [Sediminispirochaeta bajacaliforniensis]|uniref:hypothetical protein n=1 Tax=Sediminispirochaeta bajacaliforniensis TaxID=148 RepID=UPI001FE1A44A|nr:hypothetical protein [Sediminispirochaeta bajacaliforniensis]
MILIVRLWAQWREAPLDLRSMLSCSTAELFLLMPLYSWRSLLPLFLFTVLFNLFSLFTEHRAEQRGNSIFLSRILQFLVLMLAGSFLFGIFLPGLSFNSVSVSLSRLMGRNNPLLSSLGTGAFDRFVLVFFGAVVLVNEMNNVIRFILGLIKTEPRLKATTDDDLDSKELGRGKIIGVLERMLFYLFVLTGNYSSVAFVLTAKAFARFKELDDKDFAEYMLIGTLLSSALSIFWTFIIRAVIATL